MFRKIFVSIIAVLSALTSFSQLPTTRTASQLLHDLEKLKVVGSVLYIAAHPDDENTRLISWLANAKKYRTGYLSLTRGDGGQNLVGDEQGVDLGLIRTQELLDARRIDGGEQFFSTAQDFGFSKTADETLKIWDKDKLLSDVVWVIRKFQPDVIIARFPEDGRAGHGHHSVSGIMARLGYEKAGDPAVFPAQLDKGITAWQPKRALWNTFNFGNNNTISDKQFAVEVGDYLPLLGQSIGELAGESRSQHKSQGFGVSRQRGNAKEYFETIGGSSPSNELMDGVNTGWSRFDNGETIGNAIEKIISEFSVKNPSASLSALLDLRRQIRAINFNPVWKSYKLKALDEIILKCAGIYTEATVSEEFLQARQPFAVRLFAINRSEIPIQLKAVVWEGTTMQLDKTLADGKPLSESLDLAVNEGVMKTQPYWLREAPEGSMYAVSDQSLIGKPENDPLSLEMVFDINGEQIKVEQPVRYRYVDPVKGEQYQPAYITEKYLVSNGTGLLLFRNNRNDSANIVVNISSYANAKLNNAKLVLESKGSKFKRELSLPQTEAQKGMASVYRVTIPNYLRQTGLDKDNLSLAFKPGGEAGDQVYYNAKRTVIYDHIPTQAHHYLDQVSVLNIDLKTTAKRIGYLPGAGDKTAEALTAMGYSVTIIGKDDLTAEKLRQFDVVVTGVRAYNIHEYLAEAYPQLMDFVQKGGRLVVQYNTSNFISSLKGKIAPYPMEIGRTRVTDELSPVDFVASNHAVLNTPNKITLKDFEGWVQERSIYHASNFDTQKFATPIAFTDAGEKPEQGSLLIADYGKGNLSIPESYSSDNYQLLYQAPIVYLPILLNCKT